jgi:hypothetical protein
LGEKNVFCDLSAFDAGFESELAIHRAIAAADVFLTVIGPQWVAASDQPARLRLNEPDDYLRRELARAIQLRIPILPVLVGGATLPAPNNVPYEVRWCAHAVSQRQPLEMTTKRWVFDSYRLLAAIGTFPVRLKLPRECIHSPLPVPPVLQASTTSTAPAMARALLLSLSFFVVFVSIAAGWFPQSNIRYAVTVILSLLCGFYAYVFFDGSIERRRMATMRRRAEATLREAAKAQ